MLASDSSRSPNPLNVFITVDVEIWPQSWDRLTTADLKEAMRCYIYGATPKGQYGLPFQLELLKRYGLKATFFVESLFAEGFGLAPLAEIVDLIGSAGQEVQLHLHPEWVDKFPTPILPGRSGLNLRDFTEEEQKTLIGKGLDNLRRCGLGGIDAFRAGSYGADFATLRALKAYGIPYDTSYNYCYRNSSCSLHTDRPLVQPALLEGIYEIPIGFFEERPGRFRHTQLTACSLAELIFLLQQAHRQAWYSLVLVSHSFELLNSTRTRPDPIVIRRFEKLCRFLAEHPGRFRTRHFNELARGEVLVDGHAGQSEPLRSNWLRTVQRYAEQMLRKGVG